MAAHRRGQSFTLSLGVYPAIVGGPVLARRRRVGPWFWAGLAGGGALFILAVPVGPAAGDSVTNIASPWPGVAAIVVLAAFLAALVAYCVYEARLAMSESSGTPP